MRPAATAPAQPWFEGRARPEAESWVQMLDNGRYEDAWEASSSFFFKQGKSSPLSSRTFATSMYMPTYRQVGSDVEFVAENLVYGSLDKDKNRWVEVMLMVREKGKDGPWQVAEYDWRPRPLN